MCGIAGLIGFNTDAIKSIEKITDNFINILNSRGPDSNGVFLSGENEICFVHTRLAVQDISQNGNQPMVSASGRFVVIFNGEIYNHKEIRKSIPGYLFKGTSDTETIVASFEKFGIFKTLKMMNGMFAVAIWDKKTKSVTLARDKFGEKPLFYGKSNSTFIFGSSVKLFQEVKGFDTTISSDALLEYMNFGFLGPQSSIYKNVLKLTPASYVSVNLSDPSNLQIGRETKYWDFQDSLMRGRSSQIVSFQKASETLETALRNAVEKQMLADVPIGVLLSGGIDSSLIATLMQQVTPNKVDSFTVGFDEEDFNEAKSAKKIAKLIGTNHHELYLNQRKILDFIPQLGRVFDEPFADTSQIPSVLISKFTRNYVSVALTGDGGDELFGGYNRYIFANRWWKIIDALPLPVRKTFARAISTKMKIFTLLAELHPSLLMGERYQTKFTKICSALTSIDANDLFCKLLCGATVGSEFLLGVNNPPNVKLQASFTEDIAEQMMIADIDNYLSNNILVKVDRSSMSTSLETRAPFLDSNVFDITWQLPRDFKIQASKGKLITRHILNKYLPYDHISSQKKGFGVPINKWLRGPLKDWASDLIYCSDGVLGDRFDIPIIQETWEAHQSGAAQKGVLLWRFLMFQSWIENQT